MRQCEAARSEWTSRRDGDDLGYPRWVDGRPADRMAVVTLAVRIPTQLRSLTGNAAEVTVEGSTVGEALKALEAAYPGIGERIFDEGGRLRRFVNVFLADEDVRFLDGLATPVSEGQTISIVPAVAGG